MLPPSVSSHSLSPAREKLPLNTSNAAENAVDFIKYLMRSYLSVVDK
jgi:hypothetical protein